MHARYAQEFFIHGFTALDSEVFHVQLSLVLLGKNKIYVAIGMLNTLKRGLVLSKQAVVTIRCPTAKS